MCTFCNDIGYVTIGMIMLAAGLHVKAISLGDRGSYVQWSMSIMVFWLSKKVSRSAFYLKSYSNIISCAPAYFSKPKVADLD